MDFLILGGGYGTRLFGSYNPNTYFPKGLVKICGQPCIEYALNAFSENLIDKVILETNKEGLPFYKEWLKNSKFKRKTEIYTEKVSTPQRCLGVLETINNVARDYKFKHPILILAPDNLFTQNQDSLITKYIKGVRIASYELELLTDASKYGVFEFDSDTLIDCIEKPLDPKSKIIRTSCEIWNSEVFSYLTKWNKDYTSDKVGDFIHYLIKNKVNIELYSTSGKWLDIGNKNDLKKAEYLMNMLK